MSSNIESSNPKAKPWWSSAISLGTLIAIVLITLAVLGTRTGLWDFKLGFLFLGGGIILAVIGLLAGIVGSLVSISKSYTAGRSMLMGSTVLCFLIVGFLFLQYQKATSVPAIHNISTDQSDPPEFNKVLEYRAGANPVEYDMDKLGALQSAAYPAVQSLQTSLDGQASVRRAVEVLENMGLEIVDADYETLQVEATDTSLLFGFKDDVVVRIRETDQGSVIDLHSVSRVGESDLGMNAKRILQFTGNF